MIDGSGGEAGGVGAESQGGDAVAVVADGVGGVGGKERVVDENGGVGGRGGDEVSGLAVPEDGAKRADPIVVALVGFPELHGSNFHGGR